MQFASDLVPAKQQHREKAGFEKNAKMPSAASALPNTSPTKREYVAQLVPNSNSITMPVATPMAKVSAKIFVQNRAIW